MYFGIIFRVMCLPKICTKTLKELKNWNNSEPMKVDNFCESVNF